MLRTELEILSGKLIQGDLTPVVYSLIKDSPFLDDIFLYSSIPVSYTHLTLPTT